MTTPPPPSESPVAPARRVFLALPLGDTIRAEVEQLSADLRKAAQFTPARIAWVPAQNYHITLHFLGRLPEESIARLEDALPTAAAGVKPLDLQLRGLGYFPAPRDPNVVWLGVHRPPRALFDLYRAVSQVVVAAGLEAPRPDFHPHVTLGRFKSHRGSGVFVRQAQGHSAIQIGSLHVEALELMESTLSPDGAVYTRLARFPLGGESPPPPRPEGPNPPPGASE